MSTVTSSSAEGSIPSYASHPEACLRALASAAPSPAHLRVLSGTTAASMRTVTPRMAELYLCAAARHLLAEASSEQEGGSVGESQAAAAHAYDGTKPSSAASSMLHSQGAHYQDVLHGVGDAVAASQTPSQIVSSGILNALSILQSHEVLALRQKEKQGQPLGSALDGGNRDCSIHSSGENSPFEQAFGVLTLTQVEYLQACLFAQDHESPKAALEGLARGKDNPQQVEPLPSSMSRIWWPRPTADSKMSVKDVLRYYYLRGTLHLHLHEYTWAKRCLETCLCIPSAATGKSSQTVSNIALAAWKKWVLLQCVMNVHVFIVDATDHESREGQALLKDGSSGCTRQSSFLQLPKAASTSIKRFLERSYKLTAKGFPAQPMALSTKSQTILSNINPDLSSVRDDVEMTPVGAEDYEDALEPNVHGGHAASEDDAGNAASTHKASVERVKVMASSNNCHAYMELARAFEQVDGSAMKMVQQNEAVYKADGNYQLAHCLQNEYWIQRLIFDTARVYSSVPLRTLCEQVRGSPELVTNVLQRIAETGKLSIQIAEGEDMVYFNHVSVPKRDKAVAEEQHQELEALSCLIQRLHISFATSKKYISAARKRDDGTQDSGGPRGVEEM